MCQEEISMLKTRKDYNGRNQKVGVGIGTTQNSRKRNRSRENNALLDKNDGKNQRNVQY